MKNTTRESYAKRIERVIAYMTQNLDSPLDVYSLAEKANLSSYHFHRIYVASMGETLASTVRRLRLHRAAAQLLLSDVRLSSVASKAGYSSVPAFIRAFKEQYQLAPAAYRERGGITDAINFSKLKPDSRHISYQVTIVNRDPQRVVALRHVGDYMDLAHSFERLAAWGTGHNLLRADSRVFVVYYDDPNVTAKADLRADICITAPADFAPIEDNGFHVMTTPGGRSAVLKHTGPLAELTHTYDWLFGKWLPDSGEEPDDQPHFEEHLTNPRIVPPSELQTWVCLPLKMTRL